ncbi:MAG: thiamine diphosphokinase [Chloroflexi bacterium]|nr:thiamine diphosphokinase [Chloroflexota bacterium]
MIERVVIVAGGVPPSGDLLRKWKIDGSFLIAADSGATSCLNAGLVPDIVIGDMDSLESHEFDEVLNLGAEIIEYPPDKDKTDLELAFDEAAGMKPGEIVILGALGNRADHILGNIMLLFNSALKGIKARIVDEQTEIFPAGKRNMLEGKPGDIVSLIPVSDEVSGIKLTGLKYDLPGGVLKRGGTKGQSNEFISPTALIETGAGELLIVVIRK